MTGSRQRYGMLLLALGVTFFFAGVAEPGDLQRSIGTVLAGLTLILALYAAEVAPRWLRAGCCHRCRPSGCGERPRPFLISVRGALLLIAAIAVIGCGR